MLDVYLFAKQSQSTVPCFKHHVTCTSSSLGKLCFQWPFQTLINTSTQPEKNAVQQLGQNNESANQNPFYQQVNLQISWKQPSCPPASHMGKPPSAGAHCTRGLTNRLDDDRRNLKWWVGWYYHVDMLVSMLVGWYNVDIMLVCWYHHLQIFGYVEIYESSQTRIYEWYPQHLLLKPTWLWMFADVKTSAGLTNGFKFRSW